MEWSDSIFGGKGGIKVIMEALVSSQYPKESDKYKEFKKVFEAWVEGEKTDL